MSNCFYIFPARACVVLKLESYHFKISINWCFRVKKRFPFQTRDASNPLPPHVTTPSKDGIVYADSDVYIGGLLNWINRAPINDHDDHVMVMTG